jgi:periplasmic copper chaperone A
MNHLRLLIGSFIAGAALAFTSTLACAHGYKLGAIAIGHPFAQATLPGQPNGGAYLRLENQGGADKLLSATSPAARSVEMHMTHMDGDVMRMRQVDGIELPANKLVELKPGASHIMLLGLKAPLKEGDSFPMTLKFEKAGEVVVDVKVQSLQPAAPAAAASMHHH